MSRLWRLAGILTLAVVPATAWSAGFGLYEQGARALGAAGAYTARVDDGSALFFNPAGLAAVEGGDVYLGTSLIYVTREFAGTPPYPGYGIREESPKSLFSPIHGYWAQRLGKRFAVGFGVNNPFGLTTEWEDPDDFAGRFLSTKASITPFFFNPAVAVEAHPRLRIGVGLLAVHSSLELQRHVGRPNPAYDNPQEPQTLGLGTVVLEGSNALDYGFNAGVQVELGSSIALGVNYRSKVEITYDGDADFTFLGSGSALDPQLQPLFPEDQDVSADLDFPAQMVVACALEVSPSVTLEADLGWTEWSTFDALPLRFEDEELSTVLEEDWEDVFFIRTGAEIALRPDVDLRLGYYFDETPQPTRVVSPLLPDNDRHGLSLGLGKRWGSWRADLFGLVLIIPDRETEGINHNGFEGTYANGVQIAGLSLGYRY